MIHVAPAAVERHWPRVKAGLERGLRRYPQPWEPEHVRAQLASGSAFLSLIENDAFLIWSRCAGDDMRGLLFIWCCEGRGLKQHKATTYKELDDMARAMSCKRIRIIGRRGWGRDADYWRPMGYVFEHEVAQ